MPDGSPDKQLYGKVAAVANHYMGPVANRFITRQIQTHLGKDPSQLEAADLDVLADWIKIEISLLTENSDDIEDFTEKLRTLK